jgi:hypothetical protein
MFDALRRDIPVAACATGAFPRGMLIGDLLLLPPSARARGGRRDTMARAQISGYGGAVRAVAGTECAGSSIRRPGAPPTRIHLVQDGVSAVHSSPRASRLERG